MTREAALSVVKQRGDVPIEILVVNDDCDSSPESGELVKQLADLPVTVVHLGANRGVAAARNAGVRLSHGKYIAFLDSDDLWKSDKIVRQLALMQKEATAICHTDEQWIRNGKVIKKSSLFTKRSGDIFFYSLKQVNIAPSSVMLTREIWERYGGFDTSFPLCEDYELWLRVTAKESISLVEKECVVKRAGHANQLSAVPGLDYYRIKALVKLLHSETITAEQQEAVCRELARKRDIYLSGAKKRGNSETIVEIETLLRPISCLRDG